MNQRVLAELRKLFEEEKRVQWKIGDLLCREVGPPGDDHAHTGALVEIEEYANALGQSLATLLRYRRIAATYPHDQRQSSASFSAHEAASTALDPARVMAEAKRTADAHRTKLTVPLVREIAAKPKHQKPTERLHGNNRARHAPGGWALDFTSAMDGATNNLRRLVTMLQAMGQDEELTPGTQRMLISAMNRCDQHIAWIRAYVRGESVADEATEFLQKQG